MRHYRLVLVCFLAAIAVTQGLVFAQSQANTGNIEGIVNDPSGRAVAGAQVTVTNLGTNFTRALITDDEGRFRGLLLPLGPYKVTVKAANFGTLVREGLDLAVGQTISLSADAEHLAGGTGGLGLRRGADSGIGPRRKLHLPGPASRCTICPTTAAIS